MPIVLLSDSQTANNFTEYFLASENTTNNSFILNVDLSSLADGDTVEIRILTSVHQTSATHEFIKQVYAHTQSSPTFVSIPFPSPFKFSTTLLQSASASRTYDWNIVQLE